MALVMLAKTDMYGTNATFFYELARIRASDVLKGSFVTEGNPESGCFSERICVLFISCKFAFLNPYIPVLLVHLLTGDLNGTWLGRCMQASL